MREKATQICIQLIFVVNSFGFPIELNDTGPFNVGITLTGGVSVVLYDLRTERRMFTHNEGIIMTENSYHMFTCC